MLRCLELAQKAKGYTAPNPMVGAVLVHEDRIIGEGWHRSYGSSHAEVDCLNNVKSDDRHLIPASTMYVNLEPCAHYGLTPPCAARLVEEKVKKVIIANTDPFEKVKGRGVAILIAGGIEVETGLLEKEGLWVNRRFFCSQEQKRPYIILKWAKTREGFIAPSDRSRFQITGTAASELLHKWRTEEAAIMVGTTTALNDNPELTARFWPGKQPLRIVPDRFLQLPVTSNLFNKDANTWILNEKKEAGNGGLNFIKSAFDESFLPGLMARLYEARKLSLIVEGGARLLESFISMGLWDEARIFTGAASIPDGLPAPLLKGGHHEYSMQIGDDQLDLFVNKNSKYAYSPGLDL